MNIKHQYTELLTSSLEQGFLSYQYYKGICSDLIDLLETKGEGK